MMHGGSSSWWLGELHDAALSEQALLLSLWQLPVFIAIAADQLRVTLFWEPRTQVQGCPTTGWGRVAQTLGTCPEASSKEMILKVF